MQRGTVAGLSLGVNELWNVLCTEVNGAHGVCAALFPLIQHCHPVPTRDRADTASPHHRPSTHFSDDCT